MIYILEKKKVKSSTVAIPEIRFWIGNPKPHRLHWDPKRVRARYHAPAISILPCAQGRPSYIAETMFHEGRFVESI